MPSITYRVQNYTGELVHSFGDYKVSLSEDYCTIGFKELQDSAAKEYDPCKIDPLVTNIIEKLSVSLDMPYSPDGMHISRHDQGDITNYGTGSRYREPFPQIELTKSGIDFRSKQTPEEYAKEYELISPEKRHALAKALLNAGSGNLTSILACDRWSYGKYLDYMGMPDEAFLKYYKSMELLGVPPDKSQPNVESSLERFVEKNKSWIIRYRNNWFGHNDPHSEQFDKKNLDYTKLLEEVLKKPFAPIYSYYWDALIQEYEDAKDGNMEQLHYNREFCRQLARYEIMSSGYGLKCQIVSTKRGYDFDVVLFD